MSPAAVGDEAFLDQLIANQNRAIRYYLVFTVALIVCGIAVASFAILFAGSLIPDIFKSMVTLAGGFVSSLSAFQVKEVLNRREKIGIFVALKSQLKTMPDTSDGGVTSRKQIDDLIWQVVQKTALG